jgi:glycerol dehydrogenase
MFPCNPALVIVDTQVVANAPERYLVAGMGDAMATWYEARVCQRNPAARTVLGARPTLAANALGETCAHSLYAHGLDAANAVREHRVDDAVEQVVEANTLLSGVGFESGGLAAAHGVAQGLTMVARVEQNYLHGEMVAVGVVTQLVMENDIDEARRVAEFFARVGLPITFDQIGLGDASNADIESVVAGTMAFEPINNLPFAVTGERVTQGLRQANDLGLRVVENLGDLAYRRLQEDV